VRDLLDRMDARARRDLIEDIRKASASSGFAAARAVWAIIEAGREIEGPAIDQMAGRPDQAQTTSGGRGLERHDKYMEER
jgi:hypothetical protein